MKSHLRFALALGLLGVAARSPAATLTSTACTSAAGAATCSLWATAGTLALPGGPTVNTWGYAADGASAASLPGPLLVVNQGDVVTVTLTNNLAVPTALLFQGQDLVPDQAGAAPGGTATYVFTAGRPGTFLYEAGLLPNAQHQVAMGMYGALIVRPAAAPGQAYADPATAFQDEALVLLSEIDLAVSGAADPAAVDLRDWAPQYFLINGKAYPQTDEIPTAAGNAVLLRYVNAGIQHHSMSTLGLRQSVLARDGNPFAFPAALVAETIAPGQTLDALVAVPAAAAPGSAWALFDGSLKLYNGAGVAGFGGMLTFLRAGTPGAPGADVAGPATTGIVLSPNPATGASAVALSATVSDAASGGASVVAAEAYLDATSGTPIALAVAAPAVTAAAAGSLDTVLLGGLAAGNHTVFVRGQDALGNWGPFNFAVLNLDKAGPASTGLVLAPNPTGGTSDVALAATGSDAASGGGNVVAAEYDVDGGAAAAMAVSPSAPFAPVASLTATLGAASVAALAEGPHLVSVRSQDALGNWGPSGTATLQVDRTGPATAVAGTSGTATLGASPAATNGTQGLNASTPAVRVTAAFTDGASAIAAGEGFLGTAGPDGTGFPFVSSAGGFRTSPPLPVTEVAYADVPLTTLATYPDGPVSVVVHGKDAAGNWGPAGTVSILLDRQAPVASAASATPNPTYGAAGITLSATGADASSGIARGEWFEGADPGAGNGRAMAATPVGGLTATVSATITVSGWTIGNHTLRVRVRDVAGNWSPTVSTTVLVVPDAIFADGFESPTTLPGNWTSRSTASATRLGNTTAAALVGTRGLQAQGNNANYVQYNFGTAANPASTTYDARFWFRPNGNASAGKDVLSVASTTGFGASTLFRVRYRLGGGVPQVQLQVGTGTANAAWVPVLGGTSANVVEVVYQAAGGGGPGAGTVQLHVNGVPAQTLTTASTAAATAVRMGSVTGAGNATLMHFDAFASKRSVAALLGP